MGQECTDDEAKAIWKSGEGLNMIEMITRASTPRNWFAVMKEDLPEGTPRHLACWALVKDGDSSRVVGLIVKGKQLVIAEDEPNFIRYCG